MKVTRYFYLLALCGLLAATNVSAQQPEVATVAPAETYDPIVAALDSLVTLNHVVRFNGLESNCLNNPAGQSTCPIFSDAVYVERINAINSPIPLSYNRYVKEFIDLYANRKRGLTQRVMGLSNLYFPMYEEVLDREGIPLEFKYLSIVESALNPIAVSRCGATGLWQFMYNTGVLYKLNVNSYTDDRRDPYKATVAACQYFKDMYAIYGDWLLVIAAYNCGAGNVNKAIKRSGGNTNFWEIMKYLPQETRGYVPAFIAVTYVMNYSREHNLYPVTPAYSYFTVDTVHVSSQVTFASLSNSLDLPMDVISFLNPFYKRSIIPASGNSNILRLPTNKIAQFMNNEQAIYAQSMAAPKPVLPVYASTLNSSDQVVTENGISYKIVSKRIKKTHTVRKGETLSAVANRYDCTSQEIKKNNHLRSTHLKAGQKLLVYTYVNKKVQVKVPETIAKKDSGQTGTAVAEVKEKADSTNDTVKNADETSQQDSAIADNGTSKLKAPKYIYHLVQPGDTLWNIAQRYEGMTVEKIKNINKLHDGNIRPGTRLKVLVNG